MSSEKTTHEGESRKRPIIDSHVVNDPLIKPPPRPRDAIGGSFAQSPPKATSIVENDVLREFKKFAAEQREQAQRQRKDKELRLTDFKKVRQLVQAVYPGPGGYC